MKRALLVVFLMAAALGFAALGVWQVERLAWKRDLIARVQASIHAPPIEVADWSGVSDYRRVRLHGVFLYDRATLVKAVTERGEGYWLMTPLRTSRGTVLVNRGFVPSAQQTGFAPQGATDIVGLARSSEPKGGFLRSNDPGTNRWYSRDVPAIAHARRLRTVTPMFVDADATPNPGGYPVGGLTVIAFPNNHLVYALTWFALAAMSAGGAIFMLRNRPA